MDRRASSVRSETQNLWCESGNAVQFLCFFQECGAKVSMTEAEAAKVANGGYLGFY